MIGPTLHERTLCLIHQLLHNLRKVAIRSFSHVLFCPVPHGLEEVEIGGQVCVTAKLDRGLIDSSPAERVALNDIVRAGSFTLISSDRHGCLHRRRSQLSVLILDWRSNVYGSFRGYVGR